MKNKKLSRRVLYFDLRQLFRQLAIVYQDKYTDK